MYVLSICSFSSTIFYFLIGMLKSNLPKIEHLRMFWVFLLFLFFTDQIAGSFTGFASELHILLIIGVM